MQAQGSQQVSLTIPRSSLHWVPGTAGAVRAHAGVAQLVEHLFCKQVVSGSIPLASSASSVSFPETLSTHVSFQAQFIQTSEGCPSGQREQAVNLPAHAYVGSNPTPSTIFNPARTARGPQPGMLNPRRGLRLLTDSAGVAQLVESQFSKLIVEGSSPFSRSKVFSASRSSASHQTTPRAAKQTRPASLLAGRANRSRQKKQAHLAQLVEHVLGKDEVTSSSLVVGSNLQP